MELNNSFEVARPIDEAWEVLTDVERIAPCLPGAQLEEIRGEEYLGSVKVKVGPITAQYKGAATFVDKDDANHKAVLKADGRDTRGAGNASALITADLQPLGDAATRVDVNTDLTITGKVAQFGRGVMADVSAKLMDQFAENLETMLEADAGAGATESSAAEPPASEPAASGPAGAEPASAEAEVSEPVASEPVASEWAEVEAVDLIGLAGAPILKRLVPALVVIVAIIIILILVL